jgi:antitoxin ParD1/3/4
MASEPREPLLIPLDQPLYDFVREQAAAGYSSPSDFVGALIRTARRDVAAKRLESALLEGLSSGPATPMTDQDWAELRELARDGTSSSCGGK